MALSEQAPIRVPRFGEIVVARPVNNEFRISADLGEINQKRWPKGWHQGLDFDCPKGTTVFSAFDGRVVLVGPVARDGYRLWIYEQCEPHGVVRFGYTHLSKILVKETQYVKAGDPIALSGGTGRVSRPHLHFQIETVPQRVVLRPVFT